MGARLPVGYNYQAGSAGSFPGNLSTAEPSNTLDGEGAHMLTWNFGQKSINIATQIFYASEGDKVTLGLPTGNALTINERLHDGRKDDRRIVCVGGGTGIAPFVSFAKHLHAVGDKREIVVLHGASYVDELSYRDTFTKLEEDSLDRGHDKWNFRYRAAVSRPQEWFNRAWKGQTGRVENFLRARDGGKSPLEELVGEKITKENTSFYICGWQGTIDGVMDFLGPQGFVTYHDKREDGSFEVKYESYG